MTLFVNTEVSVEEIVTHAAEDPDFAMDLLATMAEQLNTAEIVEIGCVSRFHEAAAPWLIELAEAIKNPES